MRSDDEDLWWYDGRCHRPSVYESLDEQSLVRGEPSLESEEQCHVSSRHPLWHKRESNSSIAFCADAHRTRATSGQGRAYSAARDDIPDRTALFANNWRARCTISKLTLHSKNAGEWAESQLKVHRQQDIHLYFWSTSTFNKKTSPF